MNSLFLSSSEERRNIRHTAKIKSIKNRHKILQKNSKMYRKIIGVQKHEQNDRQITVQTESLTPKKMTK